MSNERDENGALIVKLRQHCADITNATNGCEDDQTRERTHAFNATHLYFDEFAALLSDAADALQGFTRSHVAERTYRTGYLDGAAGKPPAESLLTGSEPSHVVQMPSGPVEVRPVIDNGDGSYSSRASAPSTTRHIPLRSAVEIVKAAFAQNEMDPKHYALDALEAAETTASAIERSDLETALNIGLAALGYFNTEQTDRHWNDQEKVLREIETKMRRADGGKQT